jgi:hypothetical protein
VDGEQLLLETCELLVKGRIERISSWPLQRLGELQVLSANDSASGSWRMLGLLVPPEALKGTRAWGWGAPGGRPCAGAAAHQRPR